MRIFDVCILSVLLSGAFCGSCAVNDGTIEGPFELGIERKSTTVAVVVSVQDDACILDNLL